MITRPRTKSTQHQRDTNLARVHHHVPFLSLSLSLLLLKEELPVVNKKPPETLLSCALCDHVSPQEQKEHRDAANSRTWDARKPSLIQKLPGPHPYSSILHVPPFLHICCVVDGTSCRSWSTNIMTYHSATLSAGRKMCRTVSSKKKSQVKRLSVCNHVVCAACGREKLKRQLGTEAFVGAPIPLPSRTSRPLLDSGASSVPTDVMNRA